MMYTITTQFRTDRLYSITTKIQAADPKSAKAIAAAELLKLYPDAKEIKQRAQKSHRD